MAKKFITCHRGCSACCHTQVSVNKDEADLLAYRIINDNLEIDLTKMYIQANVDNDAKKWFEIPYDLRGCVFLDKDGACTVYNDRPSVCRTNNVLSPPKMCETKDGVEKSIRLLNTEKADMAMIAGFEMSGEAGTLPMMLWKALQSFGENTGAKVQTSNVSFSKNQIKSLLKDSHLSKVKKSLSKIFEV